tara:strand:- start:471 stop:668 length:198 start_codon:yes stop_codon:yes gene_type:complete
MKNENKVTAYVTLKNDVKLSETFVTTQAAEDWIVLQNAFGLLKDWMIDGGWKSVTYLSHTKIKVS